MAWRHCAGFAQTRSILTITTRIMSATCIYLTHRPEPPLDRFIAQIWYWHGGYWQNAMAQHAMDRIMPDGSGSLIVNLAEDEVRNYSGERNEVVERFPGAVLVGAHSRYSVIDANEQREVVGVNFLPGGMWPFFAPAAEELHNQHIAMRDLWGSAGETLRERILAAPSPAAKLRIVETELRTRAIRPLRRRAETSLALARLAYPPYDYSMAMLSEHVGLSTRALTRLFTLEVGMTPKLYSRIKRFESALRLMRATPVVDWSKLAAGCGYFDQSHLIRDCKTISGFTPTDLRIRPSSGGNHIALL
jgi:AraC-like DNA-binding protein